MFFRRLTIFFCILGLSACSSSGGRAPVSDLTLGLGTTSSVKRIPKKGNITGKSYTVQKGDTLYSIGWRSGISVNELANHNNIKKPYVIKVGQHLKLTNNKSLTLDISKWFTNLTVENKSHFMRGVFDGDGCISKNINGHWYMGICTYSNSFLNMLADYFINYNLKTNKKNEIHFNGRYIREPFLAIMTNNFLHMPRKYEKWQQYLNETL